MGKYICHCGKNCGGEKLLLSNTFFSAVPSLAQGSELLVLPFPWATVSFTFIQQRSQMHSGNHGCHRWQHHSISLWKQFCLMPAWPVTGKSYSSQVGDHFWCLLSNQNERGDLLLMSGTELWAELQHWAVSPSQELGQSSALCLSPARGCCDTSTGWGLSPSCHTCVESLGLTFA